MATTLSVDLLSAFNAPTSCFTQIWGSLVPTATTYGLVQGNPDDPACKPAAYNTATIYSPALCPSNYYQALNSVITSNAVTETVVDCCPSYFSRDGGGFGCVSSFSEAISSLAYTYSESGSTLVGTRTLAVGGDRGWNAHSIQVRFQSSDIATASSSSTQTSSSTSFSTTGPTTGPTDDPSSGTDEGLSTGVKAGIGAGVAVGAVAVIALVVWLVWRRRRQHRNALPSSPVEFADHPIQEMDSPPIFEAAPVKRKNLDAQPVELEAPRYGD